MRIPEICDKITYNNSKYRVDGYLQQYDPIAEMEADPDCCKITYDIVSKMIQKEKESGQYRERYRWCKKEDATHVTGSGICGCIAPIDEVEITGKVEWSEESIQGEIERHNRMIGEQLI